MLVMAANVQEYFRQALDASLRKSGIQITESAQVYLVHLLSEFSRSEKAFAGIDPGQHINLSLLLSRALDSEAEESLTIFRHMGDSSLYLLGFFEGFEKRRSVNRSFYEAMGSQAYVLAASISRAHAFKTAALFGELADRFLDLVHLLQLIAKYESPEG